MSGFTVVYDANVLYPSMLREILIRLAGTGIFQARWTDQILDEVFRNLQANPSRSRTGEIAQNPGIDVFGGRRLPGDRV